MARRRVQGAVRIRKLLKQLPDDARQEMIVELNVSGREMLGRMQGRAPVLTGATRRALTFKVLPKSLKLQVGLPGRRTKLAKHQPGLHGSRRSYNKTDPGLFYVRIQDLGRKAQVVTVRRFRAHAQRLYFRGKKFGPDVQMYTMEVRAMAGKRFVTGGMPDLRRILQRNLKSIWSKSLKRFTGTDA